MEAKVLYTNTQEATPSRVIDKSAETMLKEMRRLESLICSLRNALEVQNKGIECLEDKRVGPETVTHLLVIMIDRLAGASEQVESLIRRVDEEIGEIKLLP